MATSLRPVNARSVKRFDREEIDQLPEKAESAFTPRFPTFITPDRDELEGEIKSCTLFKDVRRQVRVNGRRYEEEGPQGDNASVEDASRWMNGVVTDPDMLAHIRAAYCQSPAGLMLSVAMSQAMHENGNISHVMESKIGRINNIVLPSIDGDNTVRLVIDSALDFFYDNDFENCVHSEPYKAVFKMAQRRVQDEKGESKLLWGFELEYIETDSAMLNIICSGKWSRLSDESKAALKTAGEVSRLLKEIETQRGHDVRTDQAISDIKNCLAILNNEVVQSLETGTLSDQLPAHTEKVLELAKQLRNNSTPLLKKNSGKLLLLGGLAMTMVGITLMATGIGTLPGLALLAGGAVLAGDVLKRDAKHEGLRKAPAHFFTRPSTPTNREDTLAGKAAALHQSVLSHPQKKSESLMNFPAGLEEVNARLLNNPPSEQRRRESKDTPSRGPFFQDSPRQNAPNLPQNDFLSRLNRINVNNAPMKWIEVREDWIQAAPKTHDSGLTCTAFRALTPMDGKHTMDIVRAVTGPASEKVAEINTPTQHLALAARRSPARDLFVTRIKRPASDTASGQDEFLSVVAVTEGSRTHVFGDPNAFKKVDSGYEGLLMTVANHIENYIRQQSTAGETPGTLSFTPTAQAGDEWIAMVAVYCRTRDPAIRLEIQPEKDSKRLRTPDESLMSTMLPLVERTPLSPSP